MEVNGDVNQPYSSRKLLLLIDRVGEGVAGFVFVCVCGCIGIRHGSPGASGAAEGPGSSWGLNPSFPAGLVLLPSFGSPVFLFHLSNLLCPAVSFLPATLIGSSSLPALPGRLRFRGRGAEVIRKKDGAGGFVELGSSGHEKPSLWFIQLFSGREKDQGLGLGCKEPKAVGRVQGADDTPGSCEMENRKMHAGVGWSRSWEGESSFSLFVFLVSIGVKAAPSLFWPKTRRSSWSLRFRAADLLCGLPGCASV